MSVARPRSAAVERRDWTLSQRSRGRSSRQGLGSRDPDHVHPGWQRGSWLVGCRVPPSRTNMQRPPSWGADISSRKMAQQQQTPPHGGICWTYKHPNKKRYREGRKGEIFYKHDLDCGCEAHRDCLQSRGTLLFCAAPMHCRAL